MSPETEEDLRPCRCEGTGLQVDGVYTFRCPDCVCVICEVAFGSPDHPHLQKACPEYVPQEVPHVE